VEFNAIDEEVSFVIDRDKELAFDAGGFCGR